MSKFMTEINKILNKEADGVKTISERVLPVDANPDSPVRPELKNQSRLTLRPSPFTPNRDNISPITAKVADRVASRVSPASGGEKDAVTPAPSSTSPANSFQPRTGTVGQDVQRASTFQPTTSSSTAPAASTGARRDMPGFKPMSEPSAADLYRGTGSERNAPTPPKDETPQGTVDRTPTVTGINPPIPPRRPANLGSTSDSSAAAPAARATPAPSPNLDPHAKSKAMFQAYSDKGDDATSADFFAADRQRTAELRGMAKENFEQFVKSFVREQNGAKEQWKGEIKKKPYMGANPEHAATSPNAQHMEEEQLDEIRGTATSFGGRHNPQRSTAKYLAGKRLQKRASLQRTGNQRRKPGIYEEAKEKFMKKLSEKRTETPLGKTATNSKYSETVNTSPESPDLTGSA